VPVAGQVSVGSGTDVTRVLGTYLIAGAVAQRCRGLRAEPSEQQSQSEDPARRPARRISSRYSRLALGRIDSRLHNDRLYPLLSLHRAIPLS